jgi:transitional endoplasmic reticulum ATPase
VTGNTTPAQANNPFINRDLKIEHAGSKIILPADPRQMSTPEAIEALERYREAEEQEMRISEVVDAFPLEGAYAMMLALQQKYGWVSAVPTPGFFGPNPPTLRTLEIGVGQTTQVIWGGFTVPGVKGRFETGVDEKDGRRVFCISGKCKKKDMAVIKEVADLTRQIVREHSIYRGKAIKLPVDDDGDLNLEEHPSFLDMSRVSADELTFSSQVRSVVEANLFTPIAKTALCRQHGIPLKRGVLLEGPYGTGKTLTAFVAAKLAQENGWTFLMIDRVAGLGEAIQFAQKYQPCVIFAEDIDRAVAGENRTVEIDDVLNTIDGIGSKGTEIMVVLTSNHLENINRAMLRPGRLDAVIHIGPPDAEAAIRLVRTYGRGLVDANDPLTKTGEVLAGTIPAVIREVVERSKLYAIAQGSTTDFRLTDDAIAGAAEEMKTHVALLSKPEAKEPTAVERVGKAIGEIVIESVRRTTVPTIERIDTNVSGLLRKIR